MLRRSIILQNTLSLTDSPRKVGRRTLKLAYFVRGSKMTAKGALHHGLPILPEVFSPTLRREPVGLLSWKYIAVLLAVLIPPPILAIQLGLGTLVSTYMLEPVAHSFIEGFCALMSVVLFYVLRQEWLQSSNPRLGLMAHGFLVYGILNLSHALSNSGTNCFVFCHSAAGLFGGLALALSVLSYELPEAVRAPLMRHSRWATIGVAASAITISSFGIAPDITEAFPLRQIDGSFTPMAITLNVGAAVLFGMAGWAFLNDFRRSGEPVLFVFALGMFLFTETHALFPASGLWGTPWWIWHFVKAAIFVGILIGIAYECTRAVRELWVSRLEIQANLDAIAEKNRHIAARNDDLVRAYRELASTRASLTEAERLAGLGQVAAIMAHEIRNPLGAIANCVGVLKKVDPSDGRWHTAVEIIGREVDRLGQLVADILTRARRPVPPTAPVRLGDLIAETLAGLSPTLIGRTTVVRTGLGSAPSVVGDRVHLQQMIWNLVVNALDALAGAGRLAISLTALGERVRLTVEDDGAGIPDELRDRIFEPFFSTKEHGTGLGLAVVKRVVDEHGGTIWVEKAEPRGTSFIVELPTARARSSAPSPVR